MSEALISIPWFAWIPIIVIVCGCVVQVVRMNHSHAERMEKIRHGMDPDGGKPVQQREV